MDSGNSESISSSGDEEYNSRADHTVLPSTFFPTQFGSISHPLFSSSSPYQQHHPHPSLFDLSSTYLHALSQPNSSNLNSFLNLDTNTLSSSQPQRSEPDCTNVNVTSSSTTHQTDINQCLLGPPHVGLGSDNATSDTNPSRINVGRNPKKRTRASRRAPTTVLTTDTSNFRAMVQEFTGIPASMFSASSSYSRRLDLLTGSSSFKSTSHHLDTTTGPFYPLRPSLQKVHHHHHQNPLLLSSSSSSPYNNMVDAIASTTNNSSSNNNHNNNYPINYQQQHPPDLGLPYHHNPQNFMLTMQNHPTFAFHPPPPHLHPFEFNAKLPSIEDQGMSHDQVNNNPNFVASEHVITSQGVTLRSVNNDGGGTRDVSSGSLDGGICKLNFSVASASTSLNHEKSTLPNNNNNNHNNVSTRGPVDSWICSSD